MPCSTRGIQVRKVHFNLTKSLRLHRLSSLVHLVPVVALRTKEHCAWDYSLLRGLWYASVLCLRARHVRRRAHRNGAHIFGRRWLLWWQWMITISKCEESWENPARIHPDCCFFLGQSSRDLIPTIPLSQGVFWGFKRGPRPWNLWKIAMRQMWSEQGLGASLPSCIDSGGTVFFEMNKCEMRWRNLWSSDMLRQQCQFACLLLRFAVACWEAVALSKLGWVGTFASQVVCACYYDWGDIWIQYDTPQFNHLAHFRDHASILFPEERSWPSVSPPKPIAVPTSSGRMTRVPLSAEMMGNAMSIHHPLFARGIAPKELQYH